MCGREVCEADRGALGHGTRGVAALNDARRGLRKDLSSGARGAPVLAPKGFPLGRASTSTRHGLFEPLYETDRPTGGTVEVFFAHSALAESFGARAGWFWWIWPVRSLPDGRPKGPFATSYGAYRQAMMSP
jgi:hypothetical protein